MTYASRFVLLSERRGERVRGSHVNRVKSGPNDTRMPLDDEAAWKPVLMFRGMRRVTIAVLIAVAVGVTTVHAQNDPDPVADAKGFQQNRDYFSQEPFEYVDPGTGSLVLSFTDLVLPGNAGRDLKFIRTYNSKEVGGLWTFGLGGLVMTALDSWPTL